MKPHLVMRLRRPLDAAVPYWERFISDKTNVVESVDAHVDRIFRDAGLAFWVTAEYSLAHDDPDDDERLAGLDRTYRIILQDLRRVPAGIVDELRALPQVEWVRLGRVGRTAVPRCSHSQSSARGSRWAGDAIGLPYAHAITKGDPSISVAILDTGVDGEHPELVGRVRRSKDMVDFDGLDTTGFVGDLYEVDDVAPDEVGHGTHVSGIVAGAGKKMPTGVVPGCDVLAVRVLAALRQGESLVGAGLVDNINAGIKWAVDQGADVINMSLGIRHGGGGLPHADVVEYALRKGVTIVAASGNDGANNRYYPSALPGVIAVGAIDRSGQLAEYSSYGAPISVLAPGSEILSSYRDGGYAASSGTSQAAPFVSGACALLKSVALDQATELTDAQVKYILANSSDGLDRNRRNDRSGFGTINLTDAIKLLNYELEGSRR